MKKFSYLSAIFISSLLSVSSILSQEKSGGKLWGYVFGDYFYKISGNSTEVSTTQFSNIEKDFQAFQMRRAYLYYDNVINENFSTQFLLEGNDKSLDAKGRYSVYIKAAYLEWKEIIPLGSIAFGLVPTPTWSWGISEKVWNFRAVEKTITDFRGLGDGSDLGIAIRGKFNSEGTVSYVAMIGNGNAQKLENNRYKKYYFNLNSRPLKGIAIEGYIDYEPYADKKSKTTLMGLLAYNTAELTIGFQSVYQKQNKFGSGYSDITKFGISSYLWVNLSEQIKAFFRYDFFNPDTKTSASGYKENFIVTGVDYMPIKDIHIMPNIWMNTFSDKSSIKNKKDADIVGRLTLFYIFNK
jgi:hypothetical protein